MANHIIRDGQLVFSQGLNLSTADYTPRYIGHKLASAIEPNQVLGTLMASGKLTYYLDLLLEELIAKHIRPNPNSARVGEIKISNQGFGEGRISLETENIQGCDLRQIPVCIDNEGNLKIREDSKWNLQPLVKPLANLVSITNQNPSIIENIPTDHHLELRELRIVIERDQKGVCYEINEWHVDQDELFVSAILVFGDGPSTLFKVTDGVIWAGQKNCFIVYSSPAYPSGKACFSSKSGVFHKRQAGDSLGTRGVVLADMYLVPSI